MEITAKLNELELILKSKQSPLLKKLNEGIDSSYIKNLIKNDRFEMPVELYTLYAWRNGVPTSEEFTIGELCLFAGGIFIPFEFAHLCYKYFQENFEILKRINLFPIFSDGGGEYYLLDIDKKSDNYGVIYLYDPKATDYPHLITIFDSLNLLLEGIIKCYEDGIYFYQPMLEELQVRDYDKEFNIYRNLNPISLFWKAFD